MHITDDRKAIGEDSNIIDSCCMLHVLYVLHAACVPTPTHMWKWWFMTVNVHFTLFNLNLIAEKHRMAG